MNTNALLLMAALATPPLIGQDAQQIANSLEVPAIKAGDKKLPMPQVGKDAKIEFLGADYEQIIDQDRNINPHHALLSDTPVNVSFKVTKDGKEALSKDYEVIVPATAASQGGNPKPFVIPSLLQWRGDTGSYTLGQTIKIKGRGTNAILLAADLAEILPGREIMLVKNEKEADIILTGKETMKKASPQSEEAYTLSVTPKRIEISGSHKGVYWGTRSLLQILRQTQGSVPCGVAYDVPRYKVRGFMFDIARTPYTLADLRQVIDTMSWYKMNDLHLVINNNYIFLEDYVKAGRDPFKEAYSAFRLESKARGKDGTPLTAQDLSYTKAEFRELIDYAQKKGVNIVAEFDTPGHALSFTRLRPDLIYQGPMNHSDRRAEQLDAGNPETLRFVTGILDEYLLKDEGLGRPVLDGCVIHVGADEFYGEAEAYRRYADSILKHVMKRGYTPRIWGSLTSKPGKTPVVAKGVQMNLWSTGWMNPIEAMNAGYDLINTNDGQLYIVPFANYYRMDRNHKGLYTNWQPNKIGNTTLPSGHPQLIGATFALWNDMIDLKHNGYGLVDIWDMISGSMDILSQKMWGPSTPPCTFEEHRQFVKAIGDAPGCNPYHTWTDAHEVNLTPDSLPLQLHQPDLGPGYHLTVELTLEEQTPGEEQVLLSSDAGELIAVMKDGSIGFRRADKTEFSYGVHLPANVKTTLELIGKAGGTELILDGQPVGTLTLNNYLDASAGFAKKTKNLCSTFILPLKELGRSFHGKVHSIRIQPTETSK